MKRARGGLLAGAGALSLILTAIAALPGQAAAPAYTVADVGAYGGEPSIVSDNLGQLYDSTPSGGTITYTSTNHGAAWSKVATADSSSGDDCLATDQSNAVYLCNLASTKEGVAPLQADVWKSLDHGTSWNHGAGAIPQCSTSCSPFGVDRDWVAASILPPATSTNQAEVVLMYHDFYGPSQIWVNISHDGGATFGAPQEVLASPGFVRNPNGTVTAQAYTFCNTVPIGVGIAPPNSPHPGRIIVAWLAADLAQNATGCNVTMTQSFHTLWIAYSDDAGNTWTPQQAFDAGIGHDASTPFAGFTMDDQGNPYIGFANNLRSNPVTCSAESTAGTVQSDPSCESDMYVVWSSDGGKTWDGGGGAISGSAARPYRVNQPAETGTHWFPAITAGRPGQVEVAYLRTTEILPTDPLGKADPGGCAGPGPANGNPTTFPPACSWNLYAAESTNLTKGLSGATWSTTQITTTPMHVGDICNLGIFCVAPASNRNLLDFIMEDLDPSGCAHIAFADDNTVNKLRAANQVSGCIKK